MVTESKETPENEVICGGYKYPPQLLNLINEAAGNPRVIQAIKNQKTILDQITAVRQLLPQLFPEIRWGEIKPTPLSPPRDTSPNVRRGQIFGEPPSADFVVAKNVVKKVKSIDKEGEI